MSKVSVFDHGWIDLVFEGRNQSYGAYQLRKQDSKTTLMALITGIALMFALVSIPVVINYFKPQIQQTVISDPVGGIEVHVINQPVLELPKPEPIQEQPAAAPSSEPTVAFTPLVATSNPATVDLPDTNAVLNTNPGTVTGTGSTDGTFLGTGPVTSTGTGTATSPGTGTGEAQIENFVDVAPQFPGGMAEFYKKVADRFKTPQVDNQKTLRVFVSFVVETDGSLTAIKAVRDPGYGMGAEAVRVLKSIKVKWKPGIKNGKPVRTAYNLPITVNIH